MKISDQLTIDFVIICKKCEREKKNSHVLLYIDWEKMYYTISCDACDTVEAYDKFAKKIDLMEIPKEGKKDEEDEIQSN